MPPADNSENWLTALGGIGGGAIIVVWLWIQNYLKGRMEGSGDLNGKHVILEQAELANIGSLPAQLALIGPKLEQMLNTEQMTRAEVKELSSKIDEAIVLLRAIDRETEITKRVREREDRDRR